MTNFHSQIASFLVEQGLIQKEDMERLFPPDQSTQELSFEEQLISSGLINEEQYRKALEEFLGIPFITMKDLPQEPVLANHLSLEFMKESKFIPVRLVENELTVAMSNPFDFYTLDAIRVATGHEVRVLYAREDGILWAIEQYYGSGTTSMEKIIEDMESVPEYHIEDEENVDHLRDMARRAGHSTRQPHHHQSHRDESKRYPL